MSEGINPKLSVGSVKQGFQNVPKSALIPLAQAMDDGARKYGAYNWRESKVILSIYLDAIQRHLWSFEDGEDIASDSKVHHLGHIMACCAIILDATRLGVIDDDRHFPGDFSKALDEIYQANKAKFVSNSTATLDLRGLDPKTASMMGMVLAGPQG